MEVTLLYSDGCPHWSTADERLRSLADLFGLTLVRHRVETSEQAERVGFLGSPTILVDGRDPFAHGDEPTGLACRRYTTPDGPAGAPTTEQLRAVLASGRERDTVCLRDRDDAQRLARAFGFDREGEPVMPTPTDKPWGSEPTQR